jgi:CheY-like chemotaxis protein
MKSEQINEVSRFEAELSDGIGNEGFDLLAHDVRSSMFGLLGSLELIADEGLSADTRDRLDRARTSGALLNDLLKLVFGGSEPQKPSATLNVPEEIALLVQRWYDQAKSADIHIDVNISRSVETLDVIDRIGFHRIFNNLIGNSIKFSQSGDISINAISSGENVVISITDSGPGFSDSALAMLFQFRGRPENSPQEGSGLGLYISEMLVAEVGGTISVKNNDNGGACVSVTFPSASAAIKPPPPHIEALPDLSHLNVLLAEDNVTNQLVVTQMLKSMGAKFQVASDGVETLAMFEQEDFDVVLLDIEMPRKSGLEVLREIRARNDAKSGIPMIALTAYVMQDHREKIDAAGADGLIAKPIAGIAPLGHQILEYVHGTPAKVPVEGVRMEASVDDPGYVDRAIYDVIAKTIGSDFLEEFLEKVVTDFDTIKKGLIAAEAEENHTDWRSHSHILISIAGAIGATNLQQLAQHLNMAANSVDKQAAQPLNLQCIKGISKVVVFLNNEKTG